MKFLLKINLNYTRERNTFYILFFLTILATFFTYPFLKYPFDIFFHLEKIDQFYTTQVLPSHGRTHLWHYLWAKIFHFFSIDNREIFLRANIIHTTQVIISFLSLFFFSKVVLRNLFLQIESLYVNYLAYWSTLIWFLMFSTASEGQHLIWIMWYSVNYQITLPLMFAVTGLTLALVFESLSIKKTLWYLLLICLGLLFILKIHAVEFLYYALYLGVIPVIFIDKIAKFCRKHPSYAVFSVVGLVSLLTVLVPIVKKIPYKEPELLRHLSFEKLPALFQKIESDGHIVVSYYNKFFTTMNELISLFSLFVLYVFCAHIQGVYEKRETGESKSVYVRVYFIAVYIYSCYAVYGRCCQSVDISEVGISFLLQFSSFCGHSYGTILFFESVASKKTLFAEFLYYNCLAIDILLL